ncbi:MAG: DMT family transporter [Longimicrobiales bacterium]
MTGTRRPLAGGALVLLAAALWATLGIFGKVLEARGLAAVELASARACIAALGAGIYLLARDRRALRIRALELPFFILYGVVGFALFQLAFFETLERTTVAIAVALLYTAPAFVVLLSWLTRQEPVARGRLLPLGLVLAGVFLVTGAAWGVATGAASLPGPAVALGLASGLTYALYTVLGKRATRHHAPATVLFRVFAVAAVALALFAPPWRIAADHTDSLALLLLLGLLPTLAAYALYARALELLPASTAALLASVEPVIAALLGWAILGEGLGWDRALGVACIVVATASLAQRPVRIQNAGH